MSASIQEIQGELKDLITEAVEMAVSLRQDSYIHHDYWMDHETDWAIDACESVGLVQTDEIIDEVIERMNSTI